MKSLFNKRVKLTTQKHLLEIEPEWDEKYLLQNQAYYEENEDLDNNEVVNNFEEVTNTAYSFLHPTSNI